MARFAVKTLEFDKVKNMLASKAATFLGKQAIISLQIESEFSKVKRLQEETAEALRILDEGRRFPFGGAFNITADVKRAELGSVLEPEELQLNHQVDGVEQVQNVYSFVSMDEVFAALNKSYVDAGAGHETAYRHFMSHHTGSYRILEQELLRVGLGAAFGLEDDRGLAEQLDAVLEEMKEDGTIADILAGYGVDAKAALVG